jgi:lipoprotein-anchoring transpeptidase ErfK/SrfK
MSVFKIIRVLAIGVFAVLATTGCAPLDTQTKAKFTVFNPYEPNALPAKIVIELAEQRAYLYIGDKLDYSTTCSTGREGYGTPTGKYKVTEKDLNHKSSAYGSYVSRDTGQIVVRDADSRKTSAPRGTEYEGAPMPYFLRFSGGYGLHQGHVPHYPASHGCIRLPASAAARFFWAAKVGTPVIVKP